MVKTVNRLFVLLLAASLMIAFLGCSGSGPEKESGADGAPSGGEAKVKLVHERPLATGGKILTYESGGEQFKILAYKWGDRQYRERFDDRLEPALAYLRENGNDDELVMSWWDYGHMIRAYTGKRVVVFSPSKSILDTVASVTAGKEWDVKVDGPLSEDARMADVARAFLATDPEITADIMSLFRAKYLLVRKLDAALAPAMVQAAGENPDEYFEVKSGESGSQDLIMSVHFKETTLYKGMMGEQLADFSKVFEDGYSAVYRLESSTGGLTPVNSDTLSVKAPEEAQNASE